MQGSLEEDYAALRKLRDASGALKEYFGDGEDPREWEGVMVSDGRVTMPVLAQCPSLAALPPGCRFHPRCGDAMPACRNIAPGFENGVACHLYADAERRAG